MRGDDTRSSTQAADMGRGDERQEGLRAMSDANSADPGAALSAASCPWRCILDCVLGPCER